MKKYIIVALLAVAGLLGCAAELEPTADTVVDTGDAGSTGVKKQGIQFALPTQLSIIPSNPAGWQLGAAATFNYGSGQGTCHGCIDYYYPAGTSAIGLKPTATCSANLTAPSWNQLYCPTTNTYFNCPAYALNPTIAWGSPIGDGYGAWGLDFAPLWNTYFITPLFSLQGAGRQSGNSGATCNYSMSGAQVILQRK